MCSCLFLAHGLFKHTTTLPSLPSPSSGEGRESASQWLASFCASDCDRSMTYFGRKERKHLPPSNTQGLGAGTISSLSPSFMASYLPLSHFLPSLLLGCAAGGCLLPAPFQETPGGTSAAWACFRQRRAVRSILHSMFLPTLLLLPLTHAFLSKHLTGSVLENISTTLLCWELGEGNWSEKDEDLIKACLLPHMPSQKSAALQLLL